MDIIIAYESALQYWRAQTSQPSKNPPEGRSASIRIKHCLKSPKKPYFDIPSHLVNDISLPLHVIVGNSEARTRNQGVLSHTWPKPPKSAIQYVIDGFFVSTPEFCFLQMASKLTLPQLILLGYELCGTYSLSNNKSVRYRDFALTSVTSLTRFVEQAHHSRGRQKALRALRYTNKGSASPMESILAMLLCLPGKLGGYKIPAPLLNFRIDIPQRSKKLTDRKYCVCDLCWPKQHVCIEYDSTLYHNTHNKIDSDARRRNVLVSLNYTVITASANQVMDPEAFNRLSQQVSKVLGRRPALINPQFTHAHLTLRKELFDFAFSKDSG